MAQRVIPIPNPKYQVAPLQTTGATIVSTKVVKVPATNATTYIGQRDPQAGLPNSDNIVKFNLASNEEFLDLSKFIVCFDVTFYGPGFKALGGTDNAQFGIPINASYDQSTQALIAYLQIGSPQGLRFEEIQRYNMLANIIAMHSQTELSKERALLDWNEFSKVSDKDTDLRKLFDGKLTFVEQSRVQIGQRTRIHMRFQHSSFLNSQMVIPLFLMRNGVEFQLHLETCRRALTFSHFRSQTSDMILPIKGGRTIANFPCLNWIIGYGIHSAVVTNADATRYTAVPALNTDGANYVPCIKRGFTHSTNVPGTAVEVASLNTLWLTAPHATALLNKVWPNRTPGLNVSLPLIAVPVSFYEQGTIVWSGFLSIDPNCVGVNNGYSTTDLGSMVLDVAGAAGVPTYQTIDQWNGSADPQLSANYTASKINHSLSALTVVAGTELTVEQAQTAIEGAQMSYIDSQHPSAYNTQDNVTSVTLQRFNSAVENVPNVPVIGFPLYSLNDQVPVPYISWATAANFHAPPADGAALASTVMTLLHRNAQCVIHIEDAVICKPSGAITLNDNDKFYVPVHPGQNALSSILSIWTLPVAQREVRYTLEKAEMMCRLIKPTSEDFARWQAMFQSDTGIPIKSKRIIYRKGQFEWNNGTIQIPIQVSVRSMNSILFVIQDSAISNDMSSLIESLSTPQLSTFQGMRLTRYEVIVGGMQYPIYPLDLQPVGNEYGEEVIPELESFLGVSGVNSLNPSFSKSSYKQVRNMLAGGPIGTSFSSLSSQHSATANTSGFHRCAYVDSANKVYAMTLAKDEVNTFTTGIDSSQSGAVHLNLYFNDPRRSHFSPLFSAEGRRFDVHVFVICDQITTYNETANLVRY